MPVEKRAHKIEQASIDALIPYARNSRTHSETQVAQIAASIREFGFTNPVLIDGDGGIIAGHGRVLAARMLGMQTVPAVRIDYMSEAQKRAYVIADNKLALNAGWDEELLALELGDLQESGFDLELTGFDEAEIDVLLAGMDATPEGETEADDVPDLQDEVVSQPGDVWSLGKHRLMCGDSTQALHVETLLAGAAPHLMVTDPPYGVEYDAVNARKTSAGSAKGKVLNDDRADWSEAWALFPGEVAYVWHAMRHAGTVFSSLESAGFEVRAEIVWAKSQLVMSRGHYHSQHESCWYAVRGTGHWHGDRKQTTLWEIDKPQKSETGHSTQKPIECMRRPIENNSQPGDAVYEPFSGSGTTLIAAEQTGRRCYAMEMSPQYVDVAVRRWQDFTGKQATLDGDGRTFDEIKGQRINNGGDA